jgi:predicted  nucleic acid-binding Zn-ribbon protein
MPEFNGDPNEAEADLRRATDAVSRADDAVTEAEARADAIEQEPFDGTPEAEADISQRMEAADREIEARRQDLADAEDDLSRTTDHWVAQGYLS